MSDVSSGAVLTLVVPLSLIVVEEARKLLKIRTGDEPALVAAPAAA